MNKKLVLSVLSTAVVASMATSAFAAPKAGVYLGGNVKKFYALDTLFSLSGTAKTDFSNYVASLTSDFNQVVYVDASGKGASIKEILDEGYNTALNEALVAGDFADSYTEIKADGTANGSYEPKKDLPQQPTGDLKVESVSVLNASQLKVTFSQAVDATTAQANANYALSTAAGALTLKASPDGAVLDTDGKTVILTLNAPITTKTEVSVTVKNVQLKDDASKVIPLFSTTVVVEDKVAPEVASVTAKTNSTAANSVTITFSEPVTSGTIKINGSAVAVANGEFVTINGLNLDVTKTHTLEIVNLTDGANNVKPLITKQFTVTQDANAPVVSGLSALGDNKILVTFSKKMKAATVTSGITAKDETLNNVSLGTVTALAGDTTGTKFVVPVAQSLYANKDSRTLTLVFAGTIEDSLGNRLNVATQAVTLTKDTVAPAVTGLTFKKDVAGNVTHVVVKFSEEVAAGTLSATNITVVDQNGVLKTGFLNNAVVAAGSKEAEFALATPAKLTGTYTFSIASGLATDTAQTPNNLAAFSGTLNFGAATPGEFKIAQSNVTTPLNNVIQINYATAVKGGAVDGSATDASKYSLNGAPLPAGTTITLDSTLNVATITLPAGSIAKTDASAIFTVAGVKNADGVTITPFTGTVSVKDNVKPELSTATLNTNGTITLGFTEAFKAANPLSEDDLVITVNDYALASTKYTLANGVGSEAGKYVLTVTGAVYNNGTAGDTTDDSLYVDVNNNSTYDAGVDIVVATGTIASTNVNLNSPAIRSVKVTTTNTGTVVPQDAEGNDLKSGTTKVVK